MYSVIILVIVDNSKKKNQSYHLSHMYFVNYIIAVSIIV